MRRAPSGDECQRLLDASDKNHFFMLAFRDKAILGTFRSPALAGDEVYLMNEEGVMSIVTASREYKQVGRAELGEDSNCSPAFLDGRIYIRGTQNLYCIGKDEE